MRIFHPETFQGSVSKKNYFEGWYYKIVSGDETFAFIPGISTGEDPHSFIQIIDGKAHETDYLRFPLSDFQCKRGKLDITIGGSRFLRDKLVLDCSEGNICINGELRFSNITPYRGSLYSPGIMGPFSYIPFMECNHGLVSADHRVDGELNWNSKKIFITDGRGYIEKDWGRSMPSSWLWVQSNIFPEQGTSFMLSVAKIPWLGNSFTGHLGFFHYNNRFYNFATYNGSTTDIEQAGQDRFIISLKNRKHNLRVEISSQGDTGELLAPVNGKMNRPIRERTKSEVRLTLRDRSGRMMYEGTGSSCGIEITGDMDELQ